ncbi:MAG: hypothetical protein ACRDQ0_18620 [Pseudonocardia sp.]
MRTVPVAAIRKEPYAGEVYDFTVPGDETFWAEGVLVHNCNPCKELDGTEFTDLAEAWATYATGGYRECLGGVKCRGTIRAVWRTPEGT